MSKEFVPAISVIIPMYNAEKYVGECLESVLVQTFQDFEIIVVDDCSTDNSCKVVKNFIKNFGEKIKLVRRKFNSGSGGIPRNDGMRSAKGKYIFFTDSDDIISKTSLEELYSIAEEFSADMVCCDKYYYFQDGQDIKEAKIIDYQNGGFVKEPTLVSENPEDRVKDLLSKNFIWSSCVKLIRRNSLIESNAKMLSIMGEDTIFTVSLICNLKNVVRVPNIILYYRLHDKSVYHKPKNVQETVKQWLSALIQGTDYLEKFLNKQESFRNRTDLKYSVFETVAKEFLQYLLPIYAQVPAHQFDKIIRKEFEKIENQTALMTFLFSRMNIFNVNLIQQQQIIQQLQNQK